MSAFTAGLIGIVLIALLTYLAFTKFANPFSNPYTVHATFSSATGLRPDSLVRIAGVDVGRVESIKPISTCGQIAGVVPARCTAADVTLTIDNQGLPLHTDATFRIRPRIFLEGDFFIDLSPGTPSAPIAADGHTFPVQQGVEPVQLDQLLTSLQADTRRNLQILLQQYGTAVKLGGPGYNRSIQYWLPAFQYSSIVAHDALGIQPHDLSNWIQAQATVAGALTVHPENLKNLVTDLNTTANAFARQSTALRAAVAELPLTLGAAIPAFNALNAAFPPVRRLANELIPGVRSAGPAIDASLPFINQLRLLVQPSELGGLTSELAATVPSLAQLSASTIPLMRDGVRPTSSCLATVVYPWSQLTINDPNFNASNGFPPRKVYVEAVDYLPGLAGESRNFDANGAYIRVLMTAGSLTYSLSPNTFGQAVAPLIATQPTLPPGGRRPPLEAYVPCETQPPITNLSTPTGPALKQLR
jgi:ABC-type transporter Mla subunit MlaD